MTAFLATLAIMLPRIVAQRERHVTLLFGIQAQVMRHTRRSFLYLRLTSDFGGGRLLTLKKYLLRLIELESRHHSESGEELVVRCGPHPPLTYHVVLSITLELAMLYLLFVGMV